VPLVHAALTATDPKLRLNNISCGGESTVSMLYGSQPPRVASSCGTPTFYKHLYPHDTQVDEAVNFLHAHQGKVDLVTINLGGNDLLPCFPVLQPDCLQQGMERIAVNLDRISTDLQTAAPGIRIVAMTSYNPIACVLPFNPELAAASQQITLSFNAELLSLYTAHHIEVADVAGAFGVADLDASARATSAWTWFCSPDHFGNVHPNDAGYRVIADAFLHAIAG
jgi:lysophospholipase L1-like esterase